jgi:diaminopimelate decarboxylase
VSRAHEAGALHADVGHRGPEWLRPPADVNFLLPGLWPRNVHKDEAGVLNVAGVDAAKLAREFGTPAYVVDEGDFRARCREFRDAFAGWSVYYAAKAFVSTQVAGWVRDEGLNLDVCSGGELAVALRAGFPPERIKLHGNNKSESELARALDAGLGGIVIDSHHEIGRLARLAGERGVVAPVLVRVKVGVEAHTHEYIATAHEDQKFGFSIAGGEAAEVIARVLSEPALDLRGLHSHIGSQIFDTSAFEVAARRVLGLHAAIRDAHGVELPLLCLGGGFGIAYTTQDDPEPAEQLAKELNAIVEHECAAYGVARPQLSIEPGRAIAGPAVFTLYEVGTVKNVELDAGASRTYISVDGGMSDNIRTALYDAEYSCTLASRRSDADPVLARVVGKHCEAGDIIVKDEFLPSDIRPGDLLAVPATGAYCRSMASNYNHVPRPPVVAVRDGRARLLVRRETEEDLLRLDVWE